MMVKMWGGGGGGPSCLSIGMSCPNIVAEQSYSSDKLSWDELSLGPNSLEFV